ncbi:Pyridoxamine 5'-phosphate oxidase [Pseudovibrio axinellae]|uniref:Pyridoxamine 5'-phosphate oxidase n=1 Tax=Pseudovibrio axinellae TaxID=989403 RepID=A0A165VRV8_9HYPH|nr:pyridoxamine 5'-phosphate oxidase family protein [Pseudovibrio axinellae]KZL15349.1 Pyridoxamine 5'-phosphate oxidase [Pseudovibrio axinellae]SER52937.1 hypothetical protein SAMN05421798_1122 [Pseudovibrio axinellae]
MALAYAKIAFTDAVRREQEERGSAHIYEWMLDEDTGPENVLSAKEASFIETMNGFYQATVNEHGWPYVQFRGGPVGFLKVLDKTRIGYADLRGNRQYLSLGNLAGNDRISIILMDYAQRRRLKLLGRVEIVSIQEDPELVKKLSIAKYKAIPERAVIINIEALDWNCSAHIPVRLSLEELEPQLYKMREELVGLRAENAELKALVSQSL